MSDVMSPVIAQAWVRACAEVKPCPKRGVGEGGDFFYATAEDVIAVSKVALASERLAVYSRVEVAPDARSLFRHSWLVHASGECFQLGSLMWPVVLNGRTIDKAIAGAMTVSLGYLYRSVLSVVCVDEALALPEAEAVDGEAPAAEAEPEDLAPWEAPAEPRAMGPTIKAEPRPSWMKAERAPVPETASDRRMASACASTDPTPAEEANAARMTDELRRALEAGHAPTNGQERRLEAVPVHAEGTSPSADSIPPAGAPSRAEAVVSGAPPAPDPAQQAPAPPLSTAAAFNGLASAAWKAMEVRSRQGEESPAYAAAKAETDEARARFAALGEEDPVRTQPLAAATAGERAARVQAAWSETVGVLGDEDDQGEPCALCECAVGAGDKFRASTTGPRIAHALCVEDVAAGRDPKAEEDALDKAMEADLNAAVSGTADAEDAAQRVESAPCEPEPEPEPEVGSSPDSSDPEARDGAVRRPPFGCPDCGAGLGSDEVQAGAIFPCRWCDTRLWVRGGGEPYLVVDSLAVGADMEHVPTKRRGRVLSIVGRMVRLRCADEAVREVRADELRALEAVIPAAQRYARVDAAEERKAEHERGTVAMRSMVAEAQANHKALGLGPNDPLPPPFPACTAKALGPEERIAVLDAVSASETVQPESEAGRVLAEAAAPAPKALRHRWNQNPPTTTHTNCERCGLLKGYPPDAVMDSPSWRMSWSADGGATWTKGTKLPPCGERKTEAA